MPPHTGESEVEYLWRLGDAKDSGILEAEWEEIKDAMNRNYRASEDEYRTESAYRKSYQCAKKFLGNVLVKRDEVEASADSVAEELELKIRELKKEKQLLRDERTQYQKYIRNEARFEQSLDLIEEKIQELGKRKYDGIGSVFLDGLESGREMVLLLSDWHIGMNFDTEFGRFNTKQAECRLAYLLSQILKIKETHNIQVCDVAVLGDMISGSIHKTIQVENRENVIEQVMKVCDLLTDFIAKLCDEFGEVTFLSVAGNHSRLEPNKEDAVKDERLDDLIGWIIKNSLKHVNNFYPIDTIDNTVAELEVAGQLYYFVHGDKGELNQNGINKLNSMIGMIPYAVCAGHGHKFEVKDINGIKVVYNGCLCGSGDSYTIEKRLHGKAEQTVLVCNSEGIECIYPVELS